MKKQITWYAVILRLLSGVGVSILVLVLLLVTLALIGANIGMTDLWCSIAAYACAGIAWVAGGFTVGLLNRRNGLLAGMIHGGCMFLVVLIVSLLFQGAAMTVLGIKTLIYLLGGPIVSGLGGIIGVHMAIKNR